MPTALPAPKKSHDFPPLVRSGNNDASPSVITANVGIGPTGRGGYGLEVELHIELPGVERSVGEELVAIADSICPYFNATRGNIPVKLILEEPSPSFV